MLSRSHTAHVLKNKTRMLPTQNTFVFSKISTRIIFLKLINQVFAVFKTPCFVFEVVTKRLQHYLHWILYFEMLIPLTTAYTEASCYYSGSCYRLTSLLFSVIPRHNTTYSACLHLFPVQLSTECSALKHWYPLTVVECMASNVTTDWNLLIVLHSFELSYFRASHEQEQNEIRAV